ncbi:flagellar assembly peptidoglycan hydrolase FlgJ [Nitrosomonas marina]|uniref:Peptidoglycan hydrolase FlgJ n=1 Tax=Nitrosomonas marina TaxID=917 RepID=A0A1H8FK81_9PROT|nr:flagellar assembly peptidoglycan hydrolase FlgJ [Nitrosomonas marina]SEN32042.1 flagellar protein FlgJ [Nitrosomonas marina]
MMNSSDISNRLAIDSKSVDHLQLLSKQDSKAALHEAAKQFEALFLQMLIKSMRDATLKSGLTDNQQTQFYTEMYDQQLAQTMSSKGIGLADIMVEQLTRANGNGQNPEVPENTVSQGGTGFVPNDRSIIPNESQESMAAGPIVHHGSDINAAAKAAAYSDMYTEQSTPAVDKSDLLWPATHDVKKPDASISTNNTVTHEEPAKSGSDKTADFINTLMPHANNAAETTGIPAHFMLAQAALESGWGKYEIRHPDNSPSHNLFGIKAGSSWKGETVETITTEYINGIPQKSIEKFRAYSSYEEGFRDYANLLSNNPRYENVLNSENAADFAHGLQRAGYATDPQYADKLLRILNTSILYNQESI